LSNASAFGTRGGSGEGLRLHSGPGRSVFPSDQLLEMDDEKLVTEPEDAARRLMTRARAS
jgi:hypothetical protein